MAGSPASHWWHVPHPTSIVWFLRAVSTPHAGLCHPITPQWGLPRGAEGAGTTAFPCNTHTSTPGPGKTKPFSSPTAVSRQGPNVGLPAQAHGRCLGGREPAVRGFGKRWARRDGDARKAWPRSQPRRAAWPVCLPPLRASRHAPGPLPVPVLQPAFPRLVGIARGPHAPSAGPPLPPPSWDTPQVGAPSRAHGDRDRQGRLVGVCSECTAGQEGVAGIGRGRNEGVPGASALGGGRWWGEGQAWAAAWAALPSPQGGGHGLLLQWPQALLKQQGSLSRSPPFGLPSPVHR